MASSCHPKVRAVKKVKEYAGTLPEYFELQVEKGSFYERDEVKASHYYPLSVNESDKQNPFSKKTKPF
jgi:hypothetical protein